MLIAVSNCPFINQDQTNDDLMSTMKMKDIVTKVIHLVAAHLVFFSLNHTVIFMNFKY